VFHRPLRSCILALAIVAAASPTAAGARSVGFVSDIVGPWSVNGKAIARGQSLPAGGIVRPVRSPGGAFSSEWRIHIALLDGKTLDAKCSNEASRCYFIALPENLSPSSSPMNRLLEAVRRLVLRQPETYTAAMTRVSFVESAGAFQNAVLELNEGRLDVNPAFADLRAGSYETQFVPVDSQGHEKNSAHNPNVTVSWKRQHLAPLLVPGLQPGLYDVESRAVTTALVLATDRQGYPATADTYARISATTRGWGANVSDAERSAFLRAALIELAAATPTKQP